MVILREVNFWRRQRRARAAHGCAVGRCRGLARGARPPKLASGELRLQAFGVSEPTTGSDTTQLKTMAIRKGDAYVVRGQKIWISRAEHSDLLLLIARTTPIDQVKKRTEGLSVFLVDMRQAVGHGLTARFAR
jgi:acyl-CoA dehydrogenase